MDADHDILDLSKERMTLFLELKKALYNLKKAGRLSSELLHKEVVSLRFTLCRKDMCLHWKRDGAR